MNTPADQNYFATDNDINDKGLYKQAFTLMLKAHEGQTDKAGVDYRMHPIRVSPRCSSEVAKVVVLLHDVLEDTDVTAEDLLELGFGEDIVNGVLGVTRRENETYTEFIERAGKNPLSLEVKIADLRDNLDVTRLPEVTENNLQRINKYLRSLRYLESIYAFHQQQITKPKHQIILCKANSRSSLCAVAQVLRCGKKISTIEPIDLSQYR